MVLVESGGDGSRAGNYLHLREGGEVRSNGRRKPFSDWLHLNTPAESAAMPSGLTAF